MSLWASEWAWKCPISAERGGTQRKAFQARPLREAAGESSEGLLWDFCYGSLRRCMALPLLSLSYTMYRKTSQRELFEQEKGPSGIRKTGLSVRQPGTELLSEKCPGKAASQVSHADRAPGPTTAGATARTSSPERNVCPSLLATENLHALISFLTLHSAIASTLALQSIHDSLSQQAEGNTKQKLHYMTERCVVSMCRPQIQQMARGTNSKKYRKDKLSTAAVCQQQTAVGIYLYMYIQPMDVGNDGERVI